MWPVFTRELIAGHQSFPIVGQPLYRFGGRLAIAGGELRAECLTGSLGLGIGHGTEQGAGLSLVFFGHGVNHIGQAMIPTPLLG